MTVKEPESTIILICTTHTHPTHMTPHHIHTQLHHTTHSYAHTPHTCTTLHTPTPHTHTHLYHSLICTHTMLTYHITYIHTYTAYSYAACTAHHILNVHSKQIDKELFIIISYLGSVKKTMWNLHIAFLIMAIIKNTSHYLMAMLQGNDYQLLCGMLICIAIMGNCMDSPQKIKKNRSIEGYRYPMHG